MFATQVLPETFSDDSEDNDVEVVGLILVDNKSHEVKKGETKIGRDSSKCSIVLENSTVSKVHAIIESDGIDDTFIYDVGSTNQTKLGKKVLKPHCRYKLDNFSNITFGSIVVKFVKPADKISNVILDKSNADSSNILDKFGDIFDVATQAVASQSHSLNGVVAFENQSKYFQTFKIPNTKTHTSPEPSKNIFDCETQCRLDPQEVASVTENHNSLDESYDIFGVSTQCQINKSQVVRTHNSSQEEVEELLNDGEDDVLCAVMSLHSPKELDSDGVRREIKAEVESLSQTLNAPTQIQAESKESQEERQIKASSPLKDTDFLVTSVQNLNSRVESNVSKNNRCTQQDEEDFIKTQEFKISESHKESQSGRLSQDEETQPYLKENLTGTSPEEDKTLDEDFILTQCFETSGIDQLNKRPSDGFPENEDFNEDLMETQIYDVEEAKKSDSVTEVRSPESLMATVDYTQRNTEDDFITTQVFKQPDEAIKTGRNSDRSDSDDEDFIATQVVDLSALPQPQKVTDFQKTRTEAGSREGSPDSLALENPCMDSEDCIGTQIFEPSECHNSETTFPGPSEKCHSEFPENTKKDDSRTIKIKCHETTEDSGDETDSDIELLLVKNEIIKKNNSPVEIFHKTEFELLQDQKRSRSSASEGSTDSYVFEVQVENNSEQIKSKEIQSPDLSDSDATDCEEIAVIGPKFIIKQEPEKLPEYEDTQVLTLTPPKNFEDISDNCATVEESPKFEVGNDNEPWSPLSQEMPRTQDNSEQIKREEIQSSDSDATDCEEIAVIGPKFITKQEPAKLPEYEDTQVLTLTPPKNFEGISENCATFEESPKFEVGNDNEPWSPLSLEMPCTQDMEASVRSTARNEIENSDKEKCEHQMVSSESQKIEVGIAHSNGNNCFWEAEHSENKVPSPKKRPRDSNEFQVIPIKKFKTEDGLQKNDEKRLSRLVQAHDIAQIRPGRTRNSMKNLKAEFETGDLAENNTNSTRTISHRKANTKRGGSKTLNCDITPYLIKRGRRSSRGEQKMETSRNEKESKVSEGSTMVLRRSGRNTLSPNNLFKPIERVFPSRARRQNSRTKKNEYFSGDSPYVTFTGFDCPSLEKIISDLGGKKVNDLSGCEVVVADKVRRTVKFLCAVGLSLPISSPQWLLACKKERKFLNPWNFILKDEESENKWDFELKTSLERSKKVKLFHGYNVFATRSTKPPVKDLLAIVECCGGKPLFDPPEVWPKKTIIVSCVEDKKFWPPAKLRNVQIVHYEFILSGVLRQKIDFKTHKLR